MSNSEKKQFRHVVVSIYNHPEFYPPTLNAIDQLSLVADKVTVLSRNTKASTWSYPENVTLKTTGEAISIPDSERKPITWKIASFRTYYTALKRLCRAQQPEWVICYDAIPLFACRLAGFWRSGKTKVWYHNHDIMDAKTVRKYSVSWFAARSERRFLSHIHLFSLSSRERLAWFENAGLDVPTVVIPNYPSLRRFGGTSAKEKTSPETLELIFQGFISGMHGFEDLLAYMRIDPTVRLTLIGPRSEAYVESLRTLAVNLGVTDRLVIEQAISYEALIKKTRTYDAGIALNKPATINYETAAMASNKIYEYAACGLPILYFGNAHHRKYLDRYVWAFACDLTVENFSDVTREIRNRLPELSRAAIQNFEDDLNFEKVFKPALDYMLGQPI